MPVHSQYRDHLENDICREAAVGLGARLVAHVPVRGVGEVLGLVHLVHLRVLALQPAEVVVVVGVVDRHRLVRIGAVRVAREAPKLRCLLRQTIRGAGDEEEELAL